jgi:uncharacterized membrane protein
MATIGFLPMYRELFGSQAGRAVLGIIGVLVLVVVIGLAVLWPSGGSSLDALTVGEAAGADVERVDRQSCQQSRGEPCQVIRARLTSGPQTGTTTTVTLPGTTYAPEVTSGDKIRIVANDVFGGAAGVEPVPGVEAYSFADFERRNPLYLLAAIFAAVVVALARWKGVRSLAGLALSLVIVTQFMVPAILEGSSPLLVALVGSLAVMLVTISLAHGTGVTSMAAVIGAAASLFMTALLAVLFVELAKITGFSSEEASLLRGSTSASEGGSGLSLEGLVLAGMVVGALGVLDDVTVSQASTVLAIHRANPVQGLRRVFTSALSVGRDHLSATVNTLVLAYVGAALPILLIFENQDTTFGDALNRETVAGEVVAMLVGSIGLVLAVPLTTALAAWLIQRVPATALGGEGEGHHHHH